MAAANLDVIRKNTALMTFMSGFMKDKGYVNEWAFVWAKVEKEPVNRIFAKFFAKKPKVKLKYIEKHAAAAQRVFAERVAKARKDGAEGNEIVAKAVDAEEFKALLKTAQTYVKDQFQQKIIPQFLSSDQYEKYVETQVDGSSLAGQLKFPSKAAKDLADAKVALILGNKRFALSCAENAVKIEAEAKLKSRGSRDRSGLKATKASDLVKQLDKIKIKV